MELAISAGKGKIFFDNTQMIICIFQVDKKKILYFLGYLLIFMYLCSRFSHRVMVD